MSDPTNILVQSVASVKSLATASDAALKAWKDVPFHFWGILWPLALMTVSAYPLVVCWPIVRERITARLDRWFLAPIFGMGWYTLLFSLLNAMFGFPITGWSFGLMVLATGAAGWGWIIWKRVDWAGEWRHWHWFVILGLLVVFFFAAATRYSMTLKYPDRLLDSDPYRHYPRTEWIVREGQIARWEPWLTGQVPIYEVQGCYVLAALLAMVGRVDTWTLWKFGSVFIGAWSALAFYIFGAYFVPGRPRRFAGVLAAAFIAGFCVHITRTNMDFSEPWALLYLPVALLAFVWALRHNSLHAGILYGVFLLLVAMSNMIPVSMAVVFLAPYCLYDLARRAASGLRLARRKHRAAAATSNPPASGGLDAPEGGVPAAASVPLPVEPAARFWSDLTQAYGGLLVGVAVFMVFIAIWQSTYAGVSMRTGARAHSLENMDIMKNVFRKEEAEAKQEAEKAGKTTGFYGFVGRFSSWHNAQIVERYLYYSKVRWGLLALVLVLLVPAGLNGLTKEPGAAPLWRGMGGHPPREWVDARAFLLIFCLLPSAQFLLLPALMRLDTLAEDELLDAGAVVARLQKTSDPVMARFREALSPATRSMVDAFKGPQEVSRELRGALLSDLNRIIEKRDFYKGEPAFAGVDLRPKTRRFSEVAPDDDDRTYFNRLLLEDVFGPALASRDILGVRFRTFTGRTYRYLLLPAYGLSLAMALAVAMLVDLLSALVPWLSPAPAIEAGTAPDMRETRETLRRRRRRRGTRRDETALAAEDSSAPPAGPQPGPMDWAGTLVRGVLVALVFMLVTAQLSTAKSFGNWPPTSKPCEEQAFRWITENLPADAVIICNWFTADFIRSYTAKAGKPLYSIFGGNNGRSGIRGNIRPAKSEAGLDIPDLTTQQQVLDYAARNPGNYYIMTTRYGPYLQLESKPDVFPVLASFKDSEHTATIYGLKANAVVVETRDSTEPIPIGESEVGEIRNLERIHDGTGGSNQRNDAAYVDPLQPRSHWAWFGLQFPKPAKIRGAQAFFGFRRDPTQIEIRGANRKRPPTMYIPTEYVLQYWDGAKWVDIPGTRVKDNTKALVQHLFAPVETERIRVYIVGMRDVDGNVAGGRDYRACCLEFDVLKADDQPLQFKNL